MCTAPKNSSLIKQSKKNKMSSLLMLPINFTPSASDILCGRGNVFSNHNGNRFFGRIIRANLKEYRDASTRPDKIRVVDDILQEIRSSGVRFAKLDSETKRWYELNDVLAHQKIGHAIRDTIRLLKDKTKTTKGSTMKQSKLAKQKLRSSALKLKNHVVPSSDTRQKTMEDILRMSTETSDFLNGIWGDSENVPPQQTSQMFEVKSEIPVSSYNNYKERNRSRFALKDEYPEENFNFSANTFFGELQGVDVLRPMRITSQ